MNLKAAIKRAFLSNIVFKQVNPRKFRPETERVFERPIGTVSKDKRHLFPRAKMIIMQRNVVEAKILDNEFQ